MQRRQYSVNLRVILLQNCMMQASGSKGAAPDREADAVDYARWPIKELRRFLTERGADPAGIVEKDDLVAKVGTGSFIQHSSSVIEMQCEKPLSGIILWS